jgi:pSer/pThr/pTyr-binding forkhead associated (FHA) protein
VEKAYAVFTFTENGEQSEYKMKDKLINIGRSRENCEIVITWDKFVSRNHALVYTRNGRFFVVDLGSRNGVFVNDEKIDGIMELTGESKIKVAETEIVFKPEI